MNILFMIFLILTVLYSRYLLDKGADQHNNSLIIIGAILLILSLGWIGYFLDDRKSKEESNEESIEASWGEKHLTIDNLYEELLTQEVDYPEIVLSQALLETNHFQSYSCRERNNLFGLRKSDGTYMSFPHWTYSVAAYKKYIQKYKEIPEDYYKFLDNLGYAEDSLYIDKVKQIHKKHVKNRNS